MIALSSEYIEILLDIIKIHLLIKNDNDIIVSLKEKDKSLLNYYFE